MHLRCANLRIGNLFSQLEGILICRLSREHSNSDNLWRVCRTSSHNSIHLSTASSGYHHVATTTVRLFSAEASGWAAVVANTTRGSLTRLDLITRNLSKEYKILQALPQVQGSVQEVPNPALIHGPIRDGKVPGYC